ncbi:MAG TPA: NAD+ synthase [Candidatus Bathyarchaeia archaeon]|nr:NAD+ synthase [Candidatus Bathyarchaeia archaeon]
MPRIAMAQINATVGDLEGNKRLIIEFGKRAIIEKADLVVLPEMATTGYPPLDLLPPREMRPPSGDRRPGQEEFVRKNKEGLEEISKNLANITSIVGFVDYDDSNLYNAAAVMRNGKITHVTYKTLLPTYDVFDEHRYFTPGISNEPTTVDLGGQPTQIGASICEDIWDEEVGYSVKVVDSLAKLGAKVIVNLNASPFHDKIRDVRLHILKRKAMRLGTAIVYVNLVGGQDELVFDGQSLAVDRNGQLIGIGKQFQEDLVLVDLNPDGTGKSAVPAPSYNREEEMFNAIVLGLRDYFRKTGFKRSLIGLSGGIDSSLVAVIAATALGKENVTGISMPSRYSSDHSKNDAKELASNLGIEYLSIPIEKIFETAEEELKPYFKGRPPNVAEENLQARLRGNILMTLSNKFGDLVLSTGNKTELALGYATLYGDMSGGLEVIGDVSKMEVYALARYYNQKMGQAVIPQSSIDKIPSAELRPDQFDPFDYASVSPLVDEIIDKRLSKEELIRKGYPKEAVEDTIRRIRGAEYKRRQAAPVIRITKKAFGLGWKMPIVNKFQT